MFAAGATALGLFLVGTIWASVILPRGSQGSWRGSWRGSWHWLVESLGHGMLLGAGAFSILVFLLLERGWGRPSYVLVALVFGVCILFGWWAVRRNPRSEAAGVDPGRWGLLAVLVIFLPTLAFTGFIGGDWHVARPPGGADAWTIWNHRSRTLYHGDGNWGRVFADIHQGHSSYPLLLPATNAGQWMVLRRETADSPRFTGLLFLLTLGLLQFAATLRFTTMWRAALAAAATLAVPAMQRWGPAQYADIPVACILLAAAGGLATHLARAPALKISPVLCGFCLGLLPWTKNEGGILAGVVMLAFLIVLATRRHSLIQPWRFLGLVGCGAVVPLAALLRFKTAWAPPDPMMKDLGTTISSNLFSAERWHVALSSFLDELNPWTDWDLWALLWPALGILLVVAVVTCRPWKRPEILFLGLIFMGALAAWLLVYVLTPAYDQKTHIDTSLHRLLLQIVPVGILLVTVATVVTEKRSPGSDPA